MSDEDVIAGAVRHLRADPAVVAAVGADQWGHPLIVQDTPPARTEFDQQVCLVLSYAGSAGGNLNNTYEQVRVQAEFWVDPMRDAGGNLLAPSEARQRMVTAYHAADRALHRPQGGTQRWGAVLTVDAARLTGLTPYQVPGSDGLWRGTAIYAVGLG